MGSPVKLKSLKLKNFAQFTDFECEFDGKITRLVGVNGSGKTTVGLTAIWAGFKGIAQKSKDGQLFGEKFRFIGSNGKSADIEIGLLDVTKNKQVTLKRHITKDTNRISFTAEDGYEINEDWLSNLLNVSFLSARHFTSMNGKQQALALNIDPSEFNGKIADEKAAASLIRAKIKDIGGIEVVAETKRINVSELIKQRDDILKFNSGQDRAPKTAAFSFLGQFFSRCVNIFSRVRKSLKKAEAKTKEVIKKKNGGK